MNKLFKHPAILILLLTIVPLIILLTLLSKTPLSSFYYFLTGPFSSTYTFGNMLNRSAPLLLTSLGAFIALRSNSFNLGGEGQVYLGATVTGILSVYFRVYESPLTLAIIIILAISITGFMAWLSAWLEFKYKVNSLISTYLISMSVVHICNYFVTGPFLMEGSNILTTEKIPETYELSRILAPSALSTGFIIAISIIVILTLLIKNSIWGYEFTVSGRNREFANSMGIDSDFYKIAGLTASGMLHGAAGIILVLGSYHAVTVGFHENLGWNGLSSALLAGSRPIMVVASSLFYSYLDAGSRYASVASDVTIELSTIIQSVLFFVISSRLIKEQIIKKGIS